MYQGIKYNVANFYLSSKHVSGGYSYELLKMENTNLDLVPRRDMLYSLYTVKLMGVLSWI